jgi:hypothetical protein
LLAAYEAAEDQVRQLQELRENTRLCMKVALAAAERKP